MSTPPSRISGALSARYRLEREIGAGGMATVYLAQDLRHDRRVALKVLRPELAAVIGAERFLAEIKLTANLQHPHILPLFDSGEADGFLFYVMPFVEGESLRDRLNREKQLPVDEAVRIATEVASALDYAHRHGVVHRDIKPENILLHDGRALVADFGIALAASKAGGARMTETGMSLGTPHYMSPEQAMGEREITARSDVYALGAVLYEMLTGEPPFTGSTAQAIVARVVTESPAPARAAAAHHPAARRGGGADRAREAAGRPVRDGGAVRRGAESADASRPRRPRPRWLQRRRRGTRRTGARVEARRDPACVAAGRGARRSRLAAGRLCRRSRAAPLRPSASCHRHRQRPGHTQLSLARGDLARRRHSGLRGERGGGTHALRPPDRPARGHCPSRGPRTPSSRSSRPTAMAGVRGRGQGKEGPAGRERTGDHRRGRRGQRRATGPRRRAGPRVYRSRTRALARERRRRRPAAAHLSRHGEGRAGSPLADRAAGRAHDRVHDLDRRARQRPPGDHLLDDSTVTDLGIKGIRPLAVLDGALVYVQADGAVMAAQLDARHRRWTGRPIPVLDPVSVIAANNGNSGIYISQGGALLTGRENRRAHLAWVGRDGASERIGREVRNFVQPRISPDGRRLAMLIYEGSKSDVWIYDLATATLSRLTTLENVTAVEWSADGREVIYSAGGFESRAGIWSQSVDAASAPTRLLELSHLTPLVSESPDRHWLALPSLYETWDVMRVALDSPRTVQPFSATRAQEVAPRILPDGHWVALESDESGTSEVYIWSFPEPTAKIQVSVGGAGHRSGLPMAGACTTTTRAPLA